MDIRKVKKLIELLEESNIAEIEIHEGEESVRISRMSTTLPAQAIVQAAPAVAQRRRLLPRLRRLLRPSLQHMKAMR